MKSVSPERPRLFPDTIQIEATSRCNYRCPTCSHRQEQGGGQHLGTDDFRTILDRLPWQPQRVILSGIGEPLLNPEFCSMADILAERGTRCELYTNGSLLTPAVWPKILSRTNIDVIRISCDGAQAKTFESLRVGGHFDAWRQSVGGFLAEVREKCRHTLTVGTATVVVSRPNLAEIGDIIRLVAELGFDQISLLDAIPVDDVAAALCPSLAEVDGCPARTTALAKSLGLKMFCYLRSTPWRAAMLPGCTQPWEYVFIRAEWRRGPLLHISSVPTRRSSWATLLSARVLGHLARPAVSAVPPDVRIGHEPRCARVCPYR